MIFTGGHRLCLRKSFSQTVSPSLHLCWWYPTVKIYSMKKKGPCHPTNPHPPSTALPSPPFLPGATLPLPAVEGEGREGNRIWEVRGCCRLLWRPRPPSPLRSDLGGREREGRGAPPPSLPRAPPPPLHAVAAAATALPRPLQPNLGG